MCFDSCVLFGGGDRVARSVEGAVGSFLRPPSGPGVDSGVKAAGAWG
jgi:hypothetical protein